MFELRGYKLAVSSVNIKRCYFIVVEEHKDAVVCKIIGPSHSGCGRQ